MRPLDPRLLRTTRAVRVHLAVTAGCGAALTGLILLQAWLVAHAVATAPLRGPDGSWVALGGTVALVGAARWPGPPSPTAPRPPRCAAPPR